MHYCIDKEQVETKVREESILERFNVVLTRQKHVEALD
jgi:hypothetical protein